MTLSSEVKHKRTINRFRTLEDDFNNIHNNKYDYTNALYVNSNTKIDIICSIHGSFFQTPETHLRGRGCKKCSQEAQSHNQKDNTDEFIRKSILKHRDKYNYDFVIYYDTKTKVEIMCNTHNRIFLQSPNAHLQGQGCPDCSSNVKLCREKFLATSKDAHNNIYDYSLVDIRNSTSKVKIICNTHGVFEQIPYSHMRGIGCQLCANERNNFEKYKNKPTLLYLIKIEDLYKIGVTQSSVNSRYKSEIKQGLNVQILQTHLFADGYQAILIEQEILKETQKFKINKEESPIIAGWTELRKLDLTDILYVKLLKAHIA